MKKYLLILLAMFSMSAIALTVIPEGANVVELAWDAEGFNAPASGSAKTYYQLECNYEGVMHIDCSAIKGYTMSDLYVNNVRKGNVVSRDLLVQRHDTIVFAMACQEDNRENVVALSYRSVAEGEIWNMPIALSEGENEVAAVKQNVDLAAWYKVSVPAQAKLTLTMPYAVAMVYTADTAEGERFGSSFENVEGGVQYTYNNKESRIVDLYIKVDAMNAAGVATVSFSAAEQEKGNGTQDDPFVLAWDTEEFFAPAAGYSKTYYQLVSNYEGVMSINADAIVGSTISDLFINGVRVGNVCTREVVVYRQDVVTFALACEQDNSANTIKLSYRAAAEGEIWNMPIALSEGENEIAAVKQNVDLAAWYKVSVPAQAKLTLTAGYMSAMVYTADTAEGERFGSSFENVEGGVQYTYNNKESRIVDLYIKVDACNAACVATVSFSAAEQEKGNGVEEDPYILAWDTEEFFAPAAGYSKTYYQLVSNYEGVMSINADAIVGSTISDLFINGARVGNVCTREVVVYRQDVVTFALACEQDNSANTIKLSYRAAAEGEIWNMPIALSEGENEIAAVKQNVDLAAWYKVSVPAQAKLTLTAGYMSAMVYTADTAEGERFGSTFENVEGGVQYTYNNKESRIVDLYIKVDACNAACVATVSFSAAEQEKGNGTQDDPFVLAWDTEEFFAPAAGYSKTYYQLVSNYEGVMSINADAIVGSTISDLFINGVRVGNVCTREVVVYRQDVVTFALACEQDNSANTIKLSYRAAAEGEIWNMPIALSEGENEIAAVKQNVDLAAWYKVSVPAQAKLTLTAGYMSAMVYTADTAEGERFGSTFENVEGGVQYTYNNKESRIVDLYIKVDACNAACVATVSFSAAEQENGNGVEEDPYILAWDTEEFFAPAAADSTMAKTYYQLTSNYEGVLSINADAIVGATMSDLFINGVRVGNVCTREVLVYRQDVITFAMVCQQDNSANTIKLSYRPVAEGEIWNMPIALGAGENEVAAVVENVNLAKWYKVTVPAQATSMTITMPYGVAMVYTAETAAGEIMGSSFENTENGMVYTYTRREGDVRNVDLYIKVSAMNVEGVATVNFAGFNDGEEIDEDAVYVVVSDANGVAYKIKAGADVKIEWKKGADLK